MSSMNKGHALVLELARSWKAGGVTGYDAYGLIVAALDGGQEELRSICDGDEPEFDELADTTAKALAGRDLTLLARLIKELHSFLDEMEGWLHAEDQAQNSGGR